MGEPFAVVSEGPALSDLAGRIKEDLPAGEPVYNILLFHARGHGYAYTFYTLKDHPHTHVIMWRSKDGTELGFHCQESEVELLKAALKQSLLFSWQAPFEIACVPAYLIAAMQEVARHKTGCYLSETKTLVFSYKSPQDDEPLRCRAGLRVRRLGTAAVRRMLEHSKYDKHRPLDTTVRLAQNIASAGVYECPDAKTEEVIDPEDVPVGGEGETPLAYISIIFYGGLAMLMTEEEHRGRGLGSLVTQVAAKMLEAQGYAPHAYVEIDNAVSSAMFSKLRGWRMTQRASWLHPPFIQPLDAHDTRE
ncbi:uncharacterized protein LOC134764629 [Penaeus indicus]|uniref:uncharacterized protein LOC134764629 n=1 Tax=Penaeus indicus TaxID=29960 RepID=UPI00300D0ADF